MSEDKREYENAIRYIATEFMVSYLGKNIEPEIFNDTPKLRQLVNDCMTTYPNKVSDPINEKLDLILQYELSSKKLIDATSLGKFSNKYSVSLWQGDITNLYIDSIVNAANSTGLGCFTVGNNCIDNTIHSNAGPRMREECKTRLGDSKIEPGNAIMTLGYNLPCRYVFHTVGPIYDINNKLIDRLTLIKCYLNCLNKLKDIKKTSIAFSCISTGSYEYPKEEACVVALSTVKRWIRNNPDYPVHIVFCVYDDENKELYKHNIPKVFT